ncbi:MAG: DUF6325 family protein [Acidimicrobiia bacterium]
MNGTANKESMGPVDLALVAFPGATFDGAISEALSDLVDRGIVAILDLLIIGKDDEGEVEVIELVDAGGDIAEQFEQLDGEVMWLLSDRDIAAAAESLEPGTTGVLVVWENTWARHVKTAIDRAGGRLVIHDRLDVEAVAESMAATPRSP